MTSWLRRIRGALGMGVTWGLAWMPLGALYGFSMGYFSIGPWLSGAGLAGAKLFGALGFVAGGLFSTVLRIAEGRRRFDQLSTPRFAALGAVGGLLLGGLLTLVGITGGPGFELEDVIILGFTALLGAVSAAGTLAIARRGDDRALETGET